MTQTLRMLFATAGLGLATIAIAAPPTTVTLTAKNGNVTFDHKAHATRVGACKTCHGEGAPQKIELDQQKAHALCIECHKTKAAGPTKCVDCHKKA
jgi:predicted CXXCH cytochrome family protein